MGLGGGEWYQLFMNNGLIVLHLCFSTSAHYTRVGLKVAELCIYMCVCMLTCYKLSVIGHPHHVAPHVPRCLKQYLGGQAGYMS